MKHETPATRLARAALCSGSISPELRVLADAALAWEKTRLKVTRWLQCGETGLSSEYLAAALTGSPLPGRNRPFDASDFGRCVGLLRAVPELRSRLDVMKTGHGTAWRILAENWATLEALYDVEEKDPAYQGRYTYKRRKSVWIPPEKESRLYEMMQSLLEPTLGEDGWVRVSPTLLVCGPGAST